MRCIDCGSMMIGDNYNIPVHCESADVPFDVESDSGPYYCGLINGVIYEDILEA